MSKIWMRKTLDQKLEPSDDASRDRIRKLKVGADVQVEVKQPRNGKFHRKYFALLNVVHDNQEKYDDFEAFRKEIIMRAGFWVEHHHVTGKVSYEAKSISFAKMDDTEFGELYGKTVDAALEWFIPGTDRDALEAAVMEFV